MNITMLSNPEELKDTRSKIEGFCKSNLPNIELASVILAIDEALQNVIRYSYKMKKDQKIDVNLEIMNDSELKVIITDYGEQVPLDTIKPRDLDKVRPGGLGVYFIKKTSKFCEYKHNEVGPGTTLTLIF